MSNPLARLFGSLANVVLDLGLPTIRGWLRDRLGPDADVADVSTDGSIVRLRGVRIPLGPRGLVVLDEAAATITSLGDAGPALRLRSFEGVLVFTRGDLRDRFARADDAGAVQDVANANATFRADVAFTASDDPDPAAWIWGDLAILRATWTTSADVPAAPLEGAARLFVSSRAWRLERGRLDGGPSLGGDGKLPVVARFAAAGVLERDDRDERDETEEANAAELLVPRALSTLAFTLEHGRIGPFLEALTALAGEDAVRARIPAALPRDTRIDAELSWSATEGARAELRLHAPTLGARATLRGDCGPTGAGLGARVDASVGLAALLRRFGAPALATPRDEDTVDVVVTAAGDVRAPAIQIDVRAHELGFRLGRPRFVPAVVVRDVAGQVFVSGGRVVGRIDAAARGRIVTAELQAPALDFAEWSVAVRAAALDAPFLRDVARTLGAPLAIADDASASVALAFGPPRRREEEAGSAASGTVTLAVGGSRLVAELGVPDVLVRVTGGVKVEDVAATGVFERAAVWPSRGDLVVALDVARDLRARGSLVAASTLLLSVRQHEGSLAYELEGAKVDLTLDRAGLRYEGLRFSGHGGRFAGYGAVPFSAPARDAPPYLVLQLEDGGPTLAMQLLRLAHPPPAIDVPPLLGARGTLALATDLGLAIDLGLATPNGTELAVALRIAKGSLDRSTASGAVAIEDALVVARAGTTPLSGIVHVDAEVVEGAARTVRARVSSAKVEYAPFVLEDVSAAVVVAASGDVLWNRAGARLADGRLSSFGVARRGGAVSARVAAASVAVHELPPIEGRMFGAYVRGRASGTVLGHREPDGALEARGDVVLDEAAFPVIDRARPALARYGLRPPNEDATGPAVATIALDARGVRVTEVAVSLYGASVRADVKVSPARAIDGGVEITLEEEYLRTSKLLTLPRVLGERLVIPIALGGTTAAPEVKAELGQTLGRFLRDNKVVDFVASAVEEAQLFFRKDAAPAARSEPPPATREAELRAAIDAHAADWDALAARRH
ncbi:MAG: hypothetical protein KIT84_35120 [Labilithrix sp.]|nr:hypothetical protein [Labilithrix sp.]MCW5816282.1 hypothetical protein [Labilithrix sp.]